MTPFSNLFSLSLLRFILTLYFSLSIRTHYFLSQFLNPFALVFCFLSRLSYPKFSLLTFSPAPSLLLHSNSPSTFTHFLSIPSLHFPPLLSECTFSLYLLIRLLTIFSLNFLSPLLLLLSHSTSNYPSTFLIHFLTLLYRFHFCGYFRSPLLYILIIFFPLPFSYSTFSNSFSYFLSILVSPLSPFYFFLSTFSHHFLDFSSPVFSLLSNFNFSLTYLTVYLYIHSLLF